ncbi:MAG: caspase family protein [Magnetococcales bacterium]|nr:caspase family protein [Magnetococcales bacterium]
MNIRSRFILSMFMGLFLLVDDTYAAQTSQCTVAREITQKAVELIVDQEEKGLKALFRARKACMTDLGIGYNLGLALYHAGRLEEARDLWQTIHSAHPNDYKTMTNLAWLKFELGDDEGAHILSFDGLLKFPDSVALAHTKVYSLFRLGRYLEAYDWMNGTKLQTPRLKEWKDMAASFVSETLWQQFLSGGQLKALRQSVNFLIKEYPAEKMFSKTKDQLIMAAIDPDAERPYPVFLPHQVWPKNGDIDNRRDQLDEHLKTFPSLHHWRKREDAYAVIVGITGYRRLPARYFGARDAQNMETLLTRRGDFENDVQHVKMRLNREATLKNINHDLNWIITKGKTHPNAKLFIYLAGLGFSWKGGEDALFIPYDAFRNKISPETTLSLRKLKDALDKLQNREIIVVVDACFGNNGTCGPDDTISANEIRPQLFSGGKALWAVSAINGPAKVHRSGRQGAFTYFLIKGFLGAADGSQAGRSKGETDGWVSMTEAFHYARLQQEAHDLESDSFLSVADNIRITRIGGEK